MMPTFLDTRYNLNLDSLLAIFIKEMVELIRVR